MNFCQQEKQGPGKIMCLKGNKADHLCLRTNCDSKPFVCSDQNCQCRRNHSVCPMVQTKSLQKVINSKRLSYKPLQKIIDDSIQGLIDSLSDLRDNLLLKLNQNVCYQGLLGQQIFFIEAIKSGNTKNITSKMIRQIFDGIQNPRKSQEFIQKIQNSMDKIFKQLQQSIQTNKLKITQKLEISLRKLKDQKYLSKNLFQGSKVIKNEEDVQKMIELFGDLKIERSQLLYRASQNQFDVQKFHEKCDNKPHTLIVLETQFGKILGGYTSLSWLQSQSDVFIRDESGTSFLFSLTNNQKFKLVNKQKSIRRYMNNKYGPMFGGGSNFYICDKTNQNEASGFFISTSEYINSNYKENNTQSYLRLGGNVKSYQFKVKQWEVWEIGFQ